MQVFTINLNDIQPREESQRKTPTGIDALVKSIESWGLLHPIIIDKDNRLVAGGNRLEAYKRLNADNPEKYQNIPAQRLEDMPKEDTQIVELEENIKRSDLKWQEECEACVRIDNLLKGKYPSWRIERRAEYVGYTTVNYTKKLSVGREIIAGNKLIIDCETLQGAVNRLERERARAEDNFMNTLNDVLIGEDDEEEGKEEYENTYGKDTEFHAEDMGEGKKDLPKVPKKKAPQVIVNANFLEWLETYSGKKFNLIHCDFPYGIDHGKSAQGGTKGRWDGYEDGEDIYFTLLREMLINRDKFMHQSCHIMFWYSRKWFKETIDMFQNLAPEMEIDYNDLIWHKTDNKGIIRDIKHTPRHTYESAMFITRGNRQIIKAVGDSYGAPTHKSKAGHVSEKPVPVLRHFMQLCVDGHSEVFDPTAGSGTALRAAHSMGAKRVLGLELNPEFAEFAQREFEQYRAIETLREKGE